MKIYIARHYNTSNGKVLIEGIRYKKNKTPKNKYDEYQGEYKKVVLDKNEFSKGLTIYGNTYPLSLDIEWKENKYVVKEK